MTPEERLKLIVVRARIAKGMDRATLADLGECAANRMVLEDLVQFDAWARAWEARLDERSGI